MRKLVLLTILALTVGLVPLFMDALHSVKLTDFLNQQLPFIIETKRMLATGAPWWSWNTHLGENFIATYSFYTITSPFVWITCLFPDKYIIIGMLISLYLKTICTSILAYVYFKRMQFATNLCIIGALIYTWSSFYICNLFYFHFCEPIMVFPLLLCAIEDFVDQTHYRILELGFVTFIVIFLNYYFAIGSLLIGGFYYILRSYTLKLLSAKELFKAFSSVCLGVGLSSVILFPTIMNLVGHPRLSTHSSIFPHYSDVVIYFVKFFLPSINEGNCDPITFIGYLSRQGFVAVVGAVPLIACCIRYKSWIACITVLFVVSYFTPLTGLYTLFTTPSYTRWLYAYILISGLATIVNIRDGYVVPMKYIYAYGGFMFILLVCSISLHLRYSLDRNSEMLSVILEIILTLLNIGFLMIWGRDQLKINRFIWLLVIAGASNLLCFSILYFSEQNPLNNTHNYSYNHIIAPKITPSSQNSMYEYRVDYLSLFDNDAMVVNKPGISSFHSFFNNNIVDLRKSVGADLKSPHFYIMKYRSELQALTSVKDIYYLDSKSSEPKRGPDEIHDDFIVQHNNNYIPFGFTYDKYLKASEILFALEDTLNVPLLMLDNLIVADEDEQLMQKYLEHGSPEFAISLDSISDVRCKITCAGFEANSEGFQASIQMPDTNVVFFSVPADKGFTAYIDDNKTHIYKVNLGMSAIIVPEGVHNIKFAYFPPGLKTGIVVSSLTFIFMIIMLIVQYRKFKVTHDNC